VTVTGGLGVLPVLLQNRTTKAKKASFISYKEIAIHQLRGAPASKLCDDLMVDVMINPLLLKCACVMW
jgi:hypothetical protein